MTTLTAVSRTAPAAGAIASFVGTMALRVKRFLNAWKNRRDATILAGFDDRMLADIGLNRSDLHDAYAEPLWRDPTSVLAARVRERRMYRDRAIVKLGATLIASPPLAPVEHSTDATRKQPSRTAL